MKKSKAYLGTVGGYKVFVTVADELKKQEENPTWKIIMNAGLFVTQRHKCYTWQQYWRKSKHNKDAKRLRELFNKSDLFS